MHLSPRQLVLARRYIAGEKLTEIAMAEHRSIKIIATQKLRIAQKLGVRNDSPAAFTLALMRYLNSLTTPSSDSLSSGGTDSTPTKRSTGNIPRYEPTLYVDSLAEAREKAVAGDVVVLRNPRCSQ